MFGQLVDRDAAQRENLAGFATARSTGTFWISVRREDEFDVGRGSSSVFQQRVEGPPRQHVHFVDDVDLEARRDRLVADAVG